MFCLLTLFVCVDVLQTYVGQVSRVDVSSKVEVVWADNSKTIVLPQVLMGVGVFSESQNAARSDGIR